MQNESGTDRSLRILQESGYRITQPRRAVIDAVQRTERAFSADELLGELLDSASGVGRATVFRTLDVLVQNSLLDRIHRPDGCHSYVRCDHIERHHHHLICSSCGVVVQFEDCTVEPLLAELGRRTNFQISSHWLEVFGHCSACHP